MFANKRKLVVVGIVSVSVFLVGVVGWNLAKHVPNIVMDHNGDGRKDVIVKPYTVESDDVIAVPMLDANGKRSEISFEERKTIVESDDYSDIVGEVEWVNAKCFFDEDGGFWFMPYDIPLRQYDADEVKEIGKEAITNDAIKSCGTLESTSE